MAMESALVLARALRAQESLEAALAAYQTLRASRTARVTETSRRSGRVAQLKSAPLRLLRDLAFRALPERARLKQLTWIATYDAGAVSLSA